MPWRCPACRTEIRHHPVETRPRTNEAYRCHVCRLEFVFDESIAGAIQLNQLLQDLAQERARQAKPQDPAAPSAPPDGAAHP